MQLYKYNVLTKCSNSLEFASVALSHDIDLSDFGGPDYITHIFVVSEFGETVENKIEFMLDYMTFSDEVYWDHDKKVFIIENDFNSKDDSYTKEEAIKYFEEKYCQ